MAAKKSTPEIRERNRKAQQRFRDKKKALKQKVKAKAEELSMIAARKAPSVNEAILGGTFVGLMVGYKIGALDFLSKILDPTASFEKAAAKAGSLILKSLGIGGIIVGIFIDQSQTDPDSVEDRFNDAFELIKKGRAELKFAQSENVRIFTEGGRTQEDFIKRNRDISEDRDKLNQFEFKMRGLWTKYQGQLWAIAGGMSGLTIYLAQENTITEIVDNIPLTG